MRTQAYTRFLSRQWHAYENLTLPRQYPTSRAFHASARALAVKPFLLADIGEGIRECEIIQWFVEPEARVEEWDKLCEVQSDKASVEITSRFAGVIKKLHYEAGEMAKVGKPLLDIDIQGEIKGEELEALTGEASTETAEESHAQAKEEPSSTEASTSPGTPAAAPTPQGNASPPGKHALLATPAVRHLMKELDVDISRINGTGRDGRVVKDDVHQYAKQRDSSPTTANQSPPPPSDSGPQRETVTPLTTVQAQMFKTMTKSLTIPHFLYGDEIDFTHLSTLRMRLNLDLAQNPQDSITKISYLPFIIKAVSLALNQYPILNARVDTDPTNSKPVLAMRSQHNIGVAMDTPSGLLVPVIKNVASHTLLSLASELTRLQTLASTGKLSTADLTGGTITVSNIGSIGGTYVSPVIVEREVAILGIGKVRTVPAFDDEGELVRKQVAQFSWCADHRVVDGATMARAAEVVRGLVERPERMVMQLR